MKLYYEMQGKKASGLNADEKASEGVEKLQIQRRRGCTSLKDRL